MTKILAAVAAWWRGLWHRDRTVVVRAVLSAEARPRCDVPECPRPGVFNVGDPGNHRACVKHAELVVDMLLAGFSDAFNRCQKMEQAGEFLQADTSRGYAVYKSRGAMGPPPRQIDKDQP